MPCVLKTQLKNSQIFYKILHIFGKIGSKRQALVVYRMFKPERIGVERLPRKSIDKGF